MQTLSQTSILDEPYFRASNVPNEYRGITKCGIMAVMEQRVQIKTIPETLPESFRPLLWSYNFAAISAEKHQKLIITQAINYGTLTQWRWIARRYGKVRVKNVLEHIPETALRPRARRLAALLFGVEHFAYALRGAQR